MLSKLELKIRGAKHFFCLYFVQVNLVQKMCKINSQDYTMELVSIPNWWSAKCKKIKPLKKKRSIAVYYLVRALCVCTCAFTVRFAIQGRLKHDIYTE